MFKEQLYAWMKNLALFYLLFTVFLHLVPEQSYERYIRFFMGIILILMFCAPLLSVFGKKEAFLESFSGFYAGEKRMLEEKSLEDIGEQYLKKSYEEELGRRITAVLLEKGIFPQEMKIQMTDRKLSVFLLFDAKDVERKEEIWDELERKCGITADTGEIQIAFHDAGAMEYPFSDGTASASSGNSDF